MQKKKILFFLPTLGEGGAEKVLVNLVNNLNTEFFDVTVMCFADIGGNRKYLLPDIRYIACYEKYYRGSANLMKLFSPKKMHRKLIKDQYDIEVAYLEGIATRIISGCDNPNTKKIAWVHTGFPNKQFASHIYRNNKEFEKCYNSFDKVVCVSKEVRDCFHRICSIPSEKVEIKYNIIDSNSIYKKAEEEIKDLEFSSTEIKLIGVGKVIENKGFDRLARIHKKLREKGILVHTYILGNGCQKEKIEDYLIAHNLQGSFTFLGYKLNPYKYVKKCDLFICSSYREGFSTAATEALIVGTPVITTNVSGMRELLGDNEYGIICDNNEDALYEAIYDVISNNKIDYLKSVTVKRGKQFSIEKLINETEQFLIK